MQAFAKVEIYSEVAEAVSVFWEFDIPSSAANAAYFFGIFSEAPEYDVEVVDVLFYVAVSGRPSENKPVANLVFNFFGVGILEAQNAVVLNKEARVKPIRLCAENFTDLAVLHAFNSFLVSRVESALDSWDNSEAFLSASSAISSISRHWTGSTHAGFSTNRCLPAFTNSLICSGRNTGGVAWIIMSISSPRICL